MNPCFPFESVADHQKHKPSSDLNELCCVLLATPQPALQPGDNPILRTALHSGADYLVTNDRHLLALDPYEGLRIISMSEYYELLRNQGLIS